MILWKIKRIVGFVMFVASLVTLIAFFMNLGYVADLFRGAEGFNGFAAALRVTLEILATPLILFTLGLIAMLIPRAKRD